VKRAGTARGFAAGLPAVVAILCAAALLGAVAFFARAAEPPRCRLVRIVEWPVQLQRDLPVIEGSINGEKVGVLLDTGAYASMLMKPTAERLGLFAGATSEIVSGFGGQSRLHETRIDELRLGEAVQKSLSVRVGGERAIPGVDFILGDDFFRQLEIEFDYAKGVIRLFRAIDCKGAFLAYWDGNALELPIGDEGKVVVPVKVNGKAARALVDSGSSSSVVALSFARKLGITPATQGVAPAGCSMGIGAGKVRAWAAPFDSVEMGEQTIRAPRLYIADYMAEVADTPYAPPEVILGTDFLRTHRVLVSRSQRKVYFSYLGGVVFPATPGKDCDSTAGPG
jgi:predicted aspartyl protease